MTTAEHKVGSIVFGVRLKSAVVVPMLIVEVNTKTTVRGVSVSYVASDGTNNITVPDDKLFDEIHTSAEDAYVSIVGRFEAAIRKVVDQAVEKAKTFSAVQVETD